MPRRQATRLGSALSAQKYVLWYFAYVQTSERNHESFSAFPLLVTQYYIYSDDTKLYFYCSKWVNSVDPAWVFHKMNHLWHYLSSYVRGHDKLNSVLKSGLLALIWPWHMIFFHIFQSLQVITNTSQRMTAQTGVWILASACVFFWGSSLLCNVDSSLWNAPWACAHSCVIKRGVSVTNRTRMLWSISLFCWILEIGNPCSQLIKMFVKLGVKT